MSWWWSWLLTILAAAAVWGGGSKRSWGWWIGLAQQPVWTVYALATRQYGFLFSVGIFGAVYSRNLWKWRRDAQRAL